MNTPNPENHDPLPAALQRDAARIQEAPFDAALHHATLRRIRAMEVEHAAPWKSSLAWATALVVLAMCAGLWHSRGPQNNAQRPPSPPPDFSGLLAAAKAAVAGADFVPSSPLPAWTSPTASLLDPLRLSSTNSKQPL